VEFNFTIIHMKVKLILFSEKHLPASRRWLNNKEFCRLFGRVYRPLSIKSQKDWYFKLKKDKTQLIFAIEVDDIYIGNIGLKNIDYQNKKAEYYIFIGSKNYRGKGVGKISSRKFFAYLKKNLKIHKIYLQVDQTNIAARKLYDKLGFKEEGILKDELLRGGKYRTIIRMAYFFKL